MNIDQLIEESRKWLERMYSFQIEGSHSKDLALVMREVYNRAILDAANFIDARGYEHSATLMVEQLEIPLPK